MPATRKNIGDTVRGITRKALTQGKLDRAAVRRVTGEAMAGASGGHGGPSRARICARARTWASWSGCS
jgi:hypothetical protein